jgi:hypothetical protein
MKNFLLILTLLALAFAGGYFFHKSAPAPTPEKLTLEQILSIKELHLVKHIYQDLFFLHKDNNATKPIRAIVQVPVTVTAYINLKEIQVIHKNDSVKQVILPHAKLTDPSFHIDRMIIRETRSLQVHVGQDMYPKVGQYISASVGERMNAMRAMAIDNHILTQAETEAKDYILMLLKAVGRSDVSVTFAESSQTVKR